MDPNKTAKGLGTSPEKEPTLPSVTMEKEERNKTKVSQAAAPPSTTDLKDASDAKVLTSPKAPISTTIMPGIVPQAPSTNSSIEEQASSSSDSSEYEDDLPPPNFPYGATRASLTRGIGPSAGISVSKQTGPLTTSFEQKGLPEFPAVPKSNQRKDGPKNATSAKGVTSSIFPSINPKSLATVSEATSKFKFTMDTPVPRQSIQPSAAEPFVFAREAKQPLEKGKFPPVKRRLFQRSKMGKDDDEEPKFPQLVFSLPESFAPPPQNKEPVEESKFLPVKPSLAEDFAMVPEAKKPAKRPMSPPAKTSLLKPSAPISPPKKPVEELKFYPVKSSLAEAFKKPAEEEMFLPVKSPWSKPRTPTSQSIEEPQSIPAQSPLTKSKFYPVKSSLAEAFSIPPQAKEPAEEEMFLPVKSPWSKPRAPTSQSMKPVEEAQSVPAQSPLTKSKFYPVKSALVEAFTIPPQAKEPNEEEMFLPVKTPRAKPRAPTSQSTKPVEEPQSLPVQSPFIKSPLIARQAKQSTELPKSPAPKHSTETEFERSTSRIVGQQERRADDEKTAQAMRELLAGKRQLRLQQEALAREQAALQFKLQGQTDNIKNVRGKEDETRKAMSAKDKEIANLKAANSRLKKTMETVVLPAPKLEEGKGSSARIEASKKSMEKEDLLAGKQEEIDNLKDEVKKWREKEAELKGSTGKEIQELKLKLQKSGEAEARALKDNEKTKEIYKDLFSLQTRNDQQAKRLEVLAAKLAKETEAKQKATSRANRLQQKIYEQADTLRDIGVEKAELRIMFHKQEVKLAEYVGLERRLEAEADLGLVKVVLEKERARMDGVDKRRELKVKATLENLEESERERRQRLMDELEAKDAELYEAQKEVRELGRKLLASNQATAAALAAAAAAASASQLSQSSPSYSSKTSPRSTSHASPPTCSTPPAPGAMPWFQLQRSPIGIQVNLSPRRLLLFLLTFLLAVFLVPLTFHNNSLSQRATEEGDMWQAVNEARRHETVGPREQRIIQEAQTLEIWDQHDKVLTQEEGWRRTREVARNHDEGF